MTTRDTRRHELEHFVVHQSLTDLKIGVMTWVQSEGLEPHKGQKQKDNVRKYTVLMHRIWEVKTRQHRH